MEFIAKLALIASVGEPVPVIARKVKWKFIPTTDHRGWISVDDKGDHWFVLWTNEKDGHNRAGGKCCYAADFRKDDGHPFILARNWTGAWRSAITLWHVYADKQEKADEIFAFIRECVDLAIEEMQRVETT